jgi:excinuclease ABC subunit A
LTPLLKEKKYFRIESFSAHFCHDISATFYLGCINLITGPSGSGKSTLLKNGLQAALEKYESCGVCHHFEKNDDEYIGVWKNFIVPEEHFSPSLKSKNKLQVLSVDQKALDKKSTSVPATLLGIMDILRKNFARTADAKQKGLEVSDFSFNGKGACELCDGCGMIEDDLFFLGKIEKSGCYVNNGKYGYFLICGKKNYKIPEWLEPEEVTISMAQRFIAYK